MPEELAIDFEDVVAAGERLAGIVNRTPVFTSRTLNERAGCEVFLCRSAGIIVSWGNIDPALLTTLW